MEFHQDRETVHLLTLSIIGLIRLLDDLKYYSRLVNSALLIKQTRMLDKISDYLIRKLESYYENIGAINKIIIIIIRL